MSVSAPLSLLMAMMGKRKYGVESRPHCKIVDAHNPPERWDLLEDRGVRDQAFAGCLDSSCCDERRRSSRYFIHHGRSFASRAKPSVDPTSNNRFPLSSSPPSIKLSKQ